MRKIFVLTIAITIGGLGIYSLALSDQGEEPRQKQVHENGTKNEPSPIPKQARVKASPKLPDTADWQQCTTKGGIYSFRIPPSWYSRSFPDSRDRARIHTGFMACPSMDNTRTGLFWYPNLPIHSKASAPVKRLLDFYKPTQIGLILYMRTDTKGLFQNLRWPFIPLTTPIKTAALLNKTWFAKIAFTKWAMHLPADFALTGSKRVDNNLCVNHLSYQVGTDPSCFTPLEGLCYLGKTNPTTSTGDWGAWLLLLVAPKGQWDAHRATLWAILRSVRYDHKKHLEIVGAGRGAEVAQQRDAVRRLQLEDLETRFAQVTARAKKEKSR